MSFCILFAGAVGSSKSPIAKFLSYNLNLPIFENDAIWPEVTEDLLRKDEAEFEKRCKQRLSDLIKSKKSFIYDASIDRRWKELREKLVENDYKFFIVSLDLSKEFLTKLYIAKGYEESLARIDSLLNDHRNFLNEYKNEVGISITDTNFKNRLTLALDASKKFIDSLD